MKTALALLFLFAGAACSSLESELPAMLEVRAGGRLTDREHPRGSGNRIVLNNDLEHPEGLAGLEVEITGTGPPRFFDADSFKVRIPPFRVPDSGVVKATARLTQHGEIVARGTVSWQLHPGEQWRLDLGRDMEPINTAVIGGISTAIFNHSVDGWPENTALVCGTFYCDTVWRFGIREDATNHEGESLWIVLWRWHPDRCEDVC